MVISFNSDWSTEIVWCNWLYIFWTGIKSHATQATSFIQTNWLTTMYSISFVKLKTFATSHQSTNKLSSDPPDIFRIFAHTNLVGLLFLGIRNVCRHRCCCRRRRRRCRRIHHGCCVLSSSLSNRVGICCYQFWDGGGKRQMLILQLSIPELLLLNFVIGNNFRFSSPSRRAANFQLGIYKWQYDGSIGQEHTPVLIMENPCNDCSLLLVCVCVWWRWWWWWWCSLNCRVLLWWLEQRNDCIHSMQLYYELNFITLDWIPVSYLPGNNFK